MLHLLRFLENWVEGTHYYWRGYYTRRRLIANGRLYKWILNLMWLRNNKLCCVCGKPITRFEEATFEHEVPRGMGGANRNDLPYYRDEMGRLRRLNGASHLLCNGLRGSRRTPLLQFPYRKDSGCQTLSL